MSFADEVESWLAGDIPWHIERVAYIARPAERRTDWPSRLVVRRPGHPLGTRYVDIHDCAPRDLREIADLHDAAAAEVSEHAAELRSYADDLEQGNDLGTQLKEHFRVMREDHARRVDERNHAFEVGRADGGVLARFGHGDLGYTLLHGGLLTVDDVRDALANGRLLRLNGIGPARFTKIVRELSGDRTPGDGVS